MSLKLYNTLTKKIEEFIPIEKGKVKIYTCGPTVYDYFHIGNARSFVMSDIINKYFRYKGYDVTFVMNLTDVDDKIIKKANSEGIPAEKVAGKYSEAFFEDIAKINVLKADAYPKATENINEIIRLISELVSKNYAYVVDGDVYFDVEKFKDYGKLSSKKIDDLLQGARVEINDKKGNPLDFALWKAVKENEPFWNSPWGKGRPGWHIECSAMSMKYLGENFDIHCGGNDLIFPHHENEIAQSEACTGKKFANYWIHFGFLNINDEKMSKSLGNIYTLRDVLKKYSPEAVRLLFTQTLYSAPLNFSFENLDACENAVKRMNNFLFRIKSLKVSDNNQELIDINKYLNGFENAMDDNLNTPVAVSVVFEFMKDINKILVDKDEISELNKQAILLTFRKLAIDVLGIASLEETVKDVGSLNNELIKILIEVRNNARKNRDYKTADLIREKLSSLGIILEDTPKETIWKFIN